MELDGGGGRVVDEDDGADDGADRAARRVDGVRWCGSESRIRRVDGGASGAEVGADLREQNGRGAQRTSARERKN